MSTAHVSRLFRQTTGVAFQTYVSQQRARRAEELLQTTGAGSLYRDGSGPERGFEPGRKTEVESES